jgi:hypothetical protein
MNKHVMAIAVCLALQPVIALGAETMIQPGVKERDNKQSFDTRPAPGRRLGDVAKSCIPMRGGNPDGVASQGASSKPSPTQSQKPDSVRNDCDPATEPRALPDGTRLVHTFPDGARLYANTRNGDIRKYSAIDQRGRALKVEIVQNPPKGMVPTPGDAIERGKQRAEEKHKRFMVRVGEALESGEIVSKGCVVVVADIDGGVSSSYTDCPKGGGPKS